MKTKKLILICILGFFVLMAILLKNNIININIYKSEMQTSVSSTWNNSKSMGKFNDSNEEISFPAVPIIVTYKAKKVGDVNSPNPVKIDISDKDFGSFWFPFIKISDYNFSVTCKNTHEIKTNSIIGQLIINGQINVSGHYKFIGAYSTEMAKNNVIDKTLNDIYNEIKKNI